MKVPELTLTSRNHGFWRRGRDIACPIRTIPESIRTNRLRLCGGYWLCPINSPPRDHILIPRLSQFQDKILVNLEKLFLRVPNLLNIKEEVKGPLTDLNDRVA
jgi:hypothetical protein